MQSLLSPGAQLVNIRRDLGTKIGLLKTFGRIVGKVSGRKYKESGRELCAGEVGLECAVSALLAVRARQEIRRLEEHILGFGKHSDPPVDDGPGIGVLTVVSFVTAVDPARFASSSGVEFLTGHDFCFASRDVH
ncbi:hypothetical protein EOD08_00520 [Mesorhizobium sp. M6A.T.Ca.TU.002.02.2.1]|nr:hypothetical protein EOD08_00520 [Mesorhizobium sp. M6A.T.Ca.TU.002.02.2.1]